MWRPQNAPVNPIPCESPNPSEIDFHRHFHNSSGLPGPRLQLRNARISLILEGFLSSHPIRMIEESWRREGNAFQAGVGSGAILNWRATDSGISASKAISEF